MTKKESSLLRLRALTRLAGPDDPIYKSGLVMTPVRRAPPPVVEQAMADASKQTSSKKGG